MHTFTFTTEELEYIRSVLGAEDNLEDESRHLPDDFYDSGDVREAVCTKLGV